MHTSLFTEYKALDNSDANVMCISTFPKMSSDRLHGKGRVELESTFQEVFASE
jgi:hypothetical protein